MPRGLKFGIGIPAALFGILLTLAGLVLLAFVGFDGTFTTPRTVARTDTHAIVISATFVDDDLRSGDVGESSVTLDVEGRGERVFLGVAEAADVATYLEDVSIAEAVELSYPGTSLVLRREGGRAEPTPPEDEKFWIASRVGDGELTWDLDEGDWSVVIMNADASAGVDVAGTATARIPALGVALAVILLVGVPLLVVGIALIVSGVRRGPGSGGRHAPGTPAPVGQGPARGVPPAPGTAPPRPDL